MSRQILAQESDKHALAELRVSSMQESLKAIGRFDPIRARERFFDSFSPGNTWKIERSGEILGFYTLEEKVDHFWVRHLYIHPKHQNLGLGGDIIERIKDKSLETNLPVRLGALIGSRSNDFYQAHGFVLTHEGEWDNYYEFSAF
ncbi:MAG: GNAT family N-acetyltransferase [Desulforhopalus sp.]